MLIDFTKEKEFKIAVDGFNNLNHFGPLHIIIEDGNLEDYYIDWVMCNEALSPDEEMFLDALKALTLEMRFLAYDPNAYQ